MISKILRKKLNLQMVLLLFVLFFTFISYLKITDFDFVQWDDDAQITKNVFVKNLTSYSISHNFEKNRFTFLTLTTFSAIYKIWGNNPAPFHWLSLILHLLNILLVYFLLKQFSKNVYTISLIVLLFALHPMRVESVAWISEIKGLLFTFFSLISFLFYIKYIEKNNKIHFYILAIIMAILASFSKIPGLLIPISFCLIDIHYKRKITFELIIEKLVLIIIIANIFSNFITLKTNIILILFLITYFSFLKKFIKKKLQNNPINKGMKIGFASILALTLVAGLTYLVLYFPLSSLDLWYESRYNYTIFERFLLAGYSLGFYLSNFLFPFQFTAIHPYPIRLSNGLLPPDYYYASIILIITILISIFLIIRRKRIPDLIFFGWFFFLINISFFLHFIPIHGRVIVADRYTYFAYLGLFMIIGAFCEKYIFKKKSPILFLISFTILLISLSALTYNRCNVWSNTKVLFTDVLQKNPEVSFAYCNLASDQMSQEKYDSAIVSYSKAIEIDPFDSYAYFNRAFSFIESKNDEKAIEDFKTAIKMNNNNKFRALSYTHIGNIYSKRGQDSIALNFYNLAINIDKESSFALNKRGVYFLNNNLLDKALIDFTNAIKIDLYYAEATNNLGSVLLAQGNSNAALERFNRAIEIEPEYTIAYFNRGFLKYNNGNPQNAIEDFDMAIKLNEKFYDAYIQRGRVNAYLKKYDNAISDFSYVLEKEPGNLLALTNRAYVLFYTKDLVNAEIDFLKAVELHPETAFCWQNLAWFYMQLPKYDKAIATYKKSIEIDENLVVSYINLGTIYLELNDFKNAEMALQKSLLLSPNNSESMFFLGDLYRKKGDKEKSCEYYNKSLILGNEQARNALYIHCK